MTDQRKEAVAYGVEISKRHPTKSETLLNERRGHTHNLSELELMLNDGERVAASVGQHEDAMTTGGSKRYLLLLEEMKDLHIRKNAGYAGDSPDPWINFREAEDLDVSAFKGVLIRMSDKWIRIKNLVKNPANDKAGESIKDTLFDLAAYALIAVAILEEKETDTPNL